MNGLGEAENAKDCKIDVMAMGRKTRCGLGPRGMDEDCRPEMDELVWRRHVQGA
jgi:hypothetical protein